MQEKNAFFCFVCLVGGEDLFSGFVKQVSRVIYLHTHECLHLQFPLRLSISFIMLSGVPKYLHFYWIMKKGDTNV